MFKIVKANEGTFRQVAENKSANNLITKDDTATMSFATIEGTELYKKEFTKYNRIYHVLSGKLELGFENKLHKLSVGDTCYMDANTEYEIKGTFKAVVVNQPAFGI